MRLLARISGNSETGQVFINLPCLFIDWLVKPVKCQR